MKRSLLFTVTKSEAGGAQQWVLDQTELLKNDADIYVITNCEGWLTTKIGDHVTIKTDKRIEKKFSMGFFLFLLAFIRSSKIDVVVASSANAGLYSRLACFISKTRVCYVSHGWSAIYNTGFFRPIFILIEWILSLFTHKVICVSDSDRSLAVKAIHISSKKIKVIANGVSQYPLSESKSLDKTKVVMVARYQHPKRQDILIRALKNSDYELYLVGMTPEQAQPEWLKYDNVHFCGVVHDFDEYSEYDVFCLISDSEGLPMSAIEAMSAGLPLVLSDVGGCGELIKGNGVLVDNTPGEILDGVKLCDANYTDYAQKSRLYYKEKYCLQDKVDEYRELYFKS